MDRSSEGRGRTLTRVDHRDARSSVAAPAILIGALVVLVGTFLDWASGAVIDATGNQTETVDLSGLNVPDGRIVMGIGLGLLVMAALMWANKRVGSWFDDDLLGVTLATIAIGRWPAARSAAIAVAKASGRSSKRSLVAIRISDVAS